jgi:glycosyltransferase involved in cell wall biosynthesis
VVVPAYNAARTLEKTVGELSETADIKIPVDDSSSDQTAALAQQLGV